MFVQGLRRRGALLVTVSSYILDWVVLIIIAAIGAAFSRLNPRKRPFDITDRSISYPLRADTVSNFTLFLVSLVAPAAIIVFVSLFLLGRPFSKISSWRSKLWAWNTGWMGLAFSFAITFAIANGTKEVLGKPRPNLLARCEPDVARRFNATDGGIGEQIEEGISLFDWRICKNTGSVLEEGFRSFPSGHSSLAFAGLVYLSLWLCSKFHLPIPLLTPRSPPFPDVIGSISINNPDTNLNSRFLRPPTPAPRMLKQQSPLSTKTAPPAPIYLLFPCLIPTGAAIYIASTRYSDYQHHGFDVLVSALLGTILAFCGFAWYHVPVPRRVGSQASQSGETGAFGGGAVEERGVWRWNWVPRQPHLRMHQNQQLHKGKLAADVEAAGGSGGGTTRSFSSEQLILRRGPPPPHPVPVSAGTGTGTTSTSTGTSAGEQSYEMHDFAAPPTDFSGYSGRQQTGAHGGV